MWIFFPVPEAPISDANSLAYSPSIYAGSDADVPAEPLADQQQVVLADPKPEIDDDMPLSALLPAQQPAPDDIVMSPSSPDDSTSSSPSSCAAPDCPDDPPAPILHPPAPDRPAAAPRYHMLSWEDVTCPDCNAICGQFKFSPGPGRRDGADPPTWIMRVRQPDGSWPSKGPCFHRRVVHLVADNYPERWISENKRCCRH